MGFKYTGARADEVNAALSGIVNAFISRIGPNLKGLYLHGSLAMGCFRPWTSDIDLLAVVYEPMDRQNKLDIVHDIMRIAEGGSEFVKVEFSVVTAEVAARASHPVPYILHYSNTWHEAYRRGNAELVINGGTDEDLAAHFMVVRKRGVALYGASVADAVGEVPREDYLKAVWYDVKGAEADAAKDPVYTVLNLCRTLMYLETGLVGSKLEGGRWAQAQPEFGRYAPLIAAAADAYTGAGVPPFGCRAGDFARAMLKRIGGAMSPAG